MITIKIVKNKKVLVNGNFIYVVECYQNNTMLSQQQVRIPTNVYIQPDESAGYLGTDPVLTNSWIDQLNYQYPGLNSEQRQTIVEEV